MALASGQAAVTALRQVLGREPYASPPASLDDPARFGPDKLPRGLQLGGIPGWLYGSSSTPFIPLCSKDAYQVLGRPELPAESRLLGQPPHDVLYDLDHRSRSRVDRLKYCRRSVDVTMRGGTTSGVVYPLAICEIARTRRLRNVGGASAGAIAAAAAAAAETGRIRGSELPPGPPVALSEEQRREGHVRRGFPGLADTMAWLAEVDDGGREHRVAQLFRPGKKARPVFRLFVASMRNKRRWSIPILLVGAFGWLSKIANLVALFAACYLLGSWRDQRRLGFPRFWQDFNARWWGMSVAGMGLLACGLALVAAGWLVLALRAARTPPKARHEEVKPPARSRGKWVRPGGLLVLGLAAVVLLIGCRQLAVWPLLAALLLLVLVMLVILVASVAWMVIRAKDNGFGMVPGSADPPEHRTLADRIAGMPKATVSRPLIPWLSGTLSELAGLPPDEVLRFGHLWWGLDFVPGTQRPDAVEVSADPRRRRVNLELMSSELVQGRAHRFPLPYVPEPSQAEVDAGLARRPERLYVRKSDLERKGRRMFPPAVVDALTAGPSATAHDVGSDEVIGDLHPLPDPWNLPVVFAVRPSLSLPALFEAVRIYRRVFPAQVRDDFGRPIQRSTGVLMYPQPAALLVEELWFTDGGVTSNFPIHFFDSVLPLWPTFGINLGAHPPGFAHQDVWLPQDWTGTAGASAALRGGLPGFLGAIVSTARAWRDNTQTAMPTYRGRVAWVRQRTDEGGTNLFMERDTIAALALRGVLAGARLRRRFQEDPWWHRHQWLRLRTTLKNLEELREDVAGSKAEPWYDQAMNAGALDLLVDATFLADPRVPTSPLDWFRPAAERAFMDVADTVTETLRTMPRAPQFKTGAPEPAPVVRQVPPL